MIVPKAYKNPIEKTYNYGWESKRQYPPLSLQTLQLMIDTGRIDASKPVDLASICNTKVFPLDVSKRHFGVNLTDEGADKFEVSKKGLNYSILLIFFNTISLKNLNFSRPRSISRFNMLVNKP